LRAASGCDSHTRVVAHLCVTCPFFWHRHLAGPEGSILLYIINMLREVRAQQVSIGRGYKESIQERTTYNETGVMSIRPSGLFESFIARYSALGGGGMYLYWLNEAPRTSCSCSQWGIDWPGIHGASAPSRPLCAGFRRQESNCFEACGMSPPVWGAVGA
jgi:hypothetical protein